MTLTKAIAVRNAATAPLDGRLAEMAQLVCNADGSPRAGVLGGAGLSIVTTTGTMNVSIAAAEFATSRGKGDGAVIFTNNGAVNVLIGTAPISNSRIDVIYVKHNDSENGDASSLPVFGVLAGVAAASPIKPTGLPIGALELATLRIYSGTTSTGGGSNVLTNTYPLTAMRGGLVNFRSKVDLDAWTTPVDGQLAYVPGKLYQRIGGAWAAVIDDTGWIVPPLTGGYSNFGAGFSVTRYRRINGVVHIEGTVVAGNVGQVIFSLPAGFRPSLEKLFITSANAGIADVRVRGSDGAVYAPGYYAGGSGALIALNISFPADA